jgi:hypothetical protein
MRSSGSQFKDSSDRPALIFHNERRSLRSLHILVTMDYLIVP